MHVGFFAHHDEPCDEGCISDIPEAAVIDVCLHLQVEEEALIHNVGKPAKHVRDENEWL